jgi:hypothetical protein
LQQSAVELSGCRLATPRCRNLHMIEPHNRHREFP